MRPQIRNPTAIINDNSIYFMYMSTVIKLSIVTFKLGKQIQYLYVLICPEDILHDLNINY